MSLFATLDDLKAATESKGSKNMFLTIKANDSKKIRFRQELPVVGMEGADSLARIVRVHTNDDDYRKRTACTRHLDDADGRCFGCERDFYAVQHLVINVALLDTETGLWESRLLDQKFSAAHVGRTLVEYCEEFGSIVDRVYRLSRTGEQRQTNYTLIPTEKSELPSEIEDLEMFDVTRTYPELSYEKQVEVHSGADDSADIM